MKSERIETNSWKEKWKDVIVKCTSVESINNMLNHGIIPYVSRHGIKKLFDKVTMKCHACAKKYHIGIVAQ